MDSVSKKLTFFCVLCQSPLENNFCPEHGIDFVTVKRRDKVVVYNPETHLQVFEMKQENTDESKLVVEDALPTDEKNTHYVVPPINKPHQSSNDEIVEVQEPAKTAPREKYRQKRRAKTQLWVYLIAFLIGGVIVLGVGYFLIGQPYSEASRLLLQAESLSQTGQIAEAKILYQAIIQKYPQSSEADMARSKLTVLANTGSANNYNKATFNKWISESLYAAHIAIENGNLLFPASQSALRHINQVMALIPDHQEAQRLKAYIYRYYNDLANTAIQQQNLDSAMIYLYYLQLIEPDNAALLKKNRMVLQQYFSSLDR
jgi:hypothetical protein